MKLTFSGPRRSPARFASPRSRHGLIDKIEFTPAAVVPGQPNENILKITPLKKPSRC